jgi:alkylation response protein AidB-like acyl-CoA dehydrogenase
MFDVHAPHQTIHTWKDFLIHIAAITIGLLLAVGLEQTVEYVHHRHQRWQIEEQMRLVFSGNISSDALDPKRLADMRGTLAALRGDIEARLRVRNDGGRAPASGNRITIDVLVMPSMPHTTRRRRTARWDSCPLNASGSTTVFTFSVNC